MKYGQMYDKLQMVLQSKIEEFRFLDYDTITPEQIWNFCVEKKWRKKNIAELRLYELVATVYNVTPSEVLSYLNYSTYAINNGMTQLNLEELEELIGPKNEDE